MEGTVDYSEEEYMDESELQDNVSISSLATTDLSTAATSESTTRYDDVEVATKQKAVAEACQATLQSPRIQDRLSNGEGSRAECRGTSAGETQWVKS